MSGRPGRIRAAPSGPLAHRLEPRGEPGRRLPPEVHHHVVDPHEVGGLEGVEGGEPVDLHGPAHALAGRRGCHGPELGAGRGHPSRGLLGQGPPQGDQELAPRLVEVGHGDEPARRVPPGERLEAEAGVAQLVERGAGGRLHPRRHRARPRAARPPRAGPSPVRPGAPSAAASRRSPSSPTSTAIRAPRRTRCVPRLGRSSRYRCFTSCDEEQEMAAPTGRVGYPAGSGTSTSAPAGASKASAAGRPRPCPGRRLGDQAQRGDAEAEGPVEARHLDLQAVVAGQRARGAEAHRRASAGPHHGLERPDRRAAVTDPVAVGDVLVAGGSRGTARSTGGRRWPGGPPPLAARSAAGSVPSSSRR